MFIADVFDAILIDNETNKVFGTTTLTSGNLSFDVTENEIRSGKGNGLRGILHSSRDVTAELDDTDYRYDWVAMKLGKNITTGAGIGYAIPKWYEVEDGGTGEAIITLDEEPLSSDSGLSIFDEDGKEITGFTVSSNEISLADVSPSVEIGDRVEVRTYKYTTDASTETIEIDTQTFAKGVTMILETLEIDENEVPRYKIQYQFDNALPNGSFTIETSSERNASSNATSFRIVKPKTSDVIGRSLRIPINNS